MESNIEIIACNTAVTKQPEQKPEELAPSKQNMCLVAKAAIIPEFQ